MRYWREATGEPNRTEILKKLIWLSFLFLTGIVTLLIFFHHSFSKSLQLEKKIQSKHLSEVGIALIKSFHDLELSGELSMESARRFALKALESVSYGENGYFWINTGEGILLMQPYTPARVGINQLEWTDIDNRIIFKDFIRKAKEGGGWVEYQWPKPATTQPYSKISYVAYFHPWDWVLGTGLYLDDMKRDVFQNVLRASGIFIICFIVFIVLAISSARNLIKQLEGLAVRDHLTGLFTKRFLMETLPLMLKKHRRNKGRILAVIFLDIDYFKTINDSYGHACGDRVLAGIGAALQKKIRPDDFCIRYGGEEFVIVGLFDDTASIVRVAERIREAVSGLRFTHDDVEFHVTLSAGIAIHRGGVKSFENTLRLADERLYQAKQKGRNRTVI